MAYWDIPWSVFVKPQEPPLWKTASVADIQRWGLEKFRTPTPSMLAAGGAVMHLGDPMKVWQEMLDEAMK